jgi:hypothetical protein
MGRKISYLSIEASVFQANSLYFYGTDLDPDPQIRTGTFNQPALFVNDLQDANKNSFFSDSLLIF